MDIYEIINRIIEEGLENEVLRLLTLYVTEKNNQLEDQNRGYRAQLKIIRKINNNKNSAISALCEEE